MDIQTSHTHVCSDHDHVISFYTYPDNPAGEVFNPEITDPSTYSDRAFLPNADYIGLKGDIKIVYTISSLGELARLRSVLGSENIRYEETPDTLTVYVDFDDYPSNEAVSCTCPWISLVFDRELWSDTKDAIITRIVTDGEYTKAKYKITEPLTLSSPTTKHVFVYEGSCTINGQRLDVPIDKHTSIQFEGSVSIVPDSSTLLVVFEAST